MEARVSTSNSAGLLAKLCCALALCAVPADAQWGEHPTDAASTFSGRENSTATDGAPGASYWDAAVFDDAMSPPQAPPMDAVAAPILTMPAAQNRPPPGIRFAEPTYPTVDVTGFFQLDAAWFHQDANNMLTPGIGDIQDFIEFRRARLAAHGQVAENVGYFVEFDFGFPGRPSFMDVWFEVQETPYGTIRVGQYRQPFSMDAMTSVRDLTFFERALPFAFLPFRQTGVMAYGTAYDDLVTWAVSGYRFAADPFGDVFGDSGYGLSTRGTAAWIYEPETNYVVHFGGSFSHNRPNTDAFQYRNTPEIGFSVPADVPFFVDTGPFAADAITLAGLEAAYARGSFLFQSEAILSRVNQPSGSATLHGAYAQASYVLTGEVRPYNLKQGVFGRVKPAHDLGRCGGGAWEIASRVSHIDLDDGAIAGGRLTDFTFGLNWYLNAFTKLQFNYTRASLDNPVTGDSNADVYAVRAQLDF
jgi:phosphate-selective porin OprO/OprP